MGGPQAEVPTIAGGESTNRSLDAEPIALARGTEVGRFVVIRRLGAGGMGVVYLAYDPELDRRIALKLVRARVSEDDSTGRAAVLREAQALARLSHPNVVTVHDVGTFRGQVWLAMEFVEGATLRQWWAAAERPLPEILDVMIAAGRGLAAAHAADLVHRDFKPDNVMVGDDGRVRVMDFGLAASASLPSRDEPDGSTTTRVSGTPAYMAPEQFEGGSVGAAVDQYAFCATLFEGITGRRRFAGETVAATAAAVIAGEDADVVAAAELPGWLRRILRRGLAVDPARRFASVAELLEALASGRRRRRRNITLVGAVLVVAAIPSAFAIAELRRRQAVAACDRAADEWVESAWPGSGDATRRALETWLAGRGNEAASVAPLAGALDRAAAGWKQARAEACVRGTVTGELDATQYLWAESCLAEERDAVDDELADALEGTSRYLLERMLVSLAEADDPRRCLDVETLTAMRWPDDPATLAIARHQRRQLRAAQTLVAVGDQEGAARLAHAVLDDPAAAMWPSLAGQAHLLVGTIRSEVGEYDRAGEELQAALVAAIEADDPSTAVTTTAHLLYLVGYRQHRLDEADRWFRLGLAWLTRAHDERGLLESELRSAAGTTWVGNERVDEGRAELERAVELIEAALGPDHFRTGQAYANLGAAALGTNDLDTAADHFAHALAVEQAVLGPDHPSLDALYNNVAVVEYRRGNLEPALAAFRRSAALAERGYGRSSPQRLQTLTNVSAVLFESNRIEEGLTNIREAIASYREAGGADGDALVGALAAQMQGSLRGKDEPAARAAAIELLDEAETARVRARSVEAAYRVLRQLDDPQALRAAERMVALTTDDEHPIARAFRQLALARLLVERGGDVERVRRLAEEGRATLARMRTEVSAPPATWFELDVASIWLGTQGI